jgi:hypothetical protein
MTFDIITFFFAEGRGDQGVQDYISNFTFLQPGFSFTQPACRVETQGAAKHDIRLSLYYCLLTREKKNLTFTFPKLPPPEA